MSNPLSNDLIAQFAKAAVGSDEKTEDGVLRGTITRVSTGEGDEGVLCVKIDGSDLETPVSRFPSTIEDFAEGDRVELNVKNHALTITGNTTTRAIGKVTEGNLRSEITQTAAEIRSEVADDVAGLNSIIIQTATEIRSEVNNDVTGLNSKIEQTAESINQTVTNNQNEFTTFKQTVEGWEFVDENGKIVIKDGAISWDMLDSGAQQEVTDAQNAAATAQSAANAAKSTANSAQDAADAAVETANAAKKLASANTIPDYIKSTYIDSTEIVSPMITGNDISVWGTFQTLSADGTATGYMGAARGMDSDGEITHGVALSYAWDSYSEEVSDSYVIVTNAGVRLQHGDSCVVAAESNVTIDGSDIINFDIGGEYKAILDYQYFRPYYRAGYLETMYLGSSTAPWEAVWSSVGQCTTSDRNKKNTIEDLPEKYITLFDNLRPVRFKMNNGTSDRYHVGYIAQEVEKAMIAAGVDGQEFGGFVKDRDDDGNDIYFLRYGEFDAMRDAKIKQLETKALNLETKNLELEARIEALEKLLMQ